MACHYDLTVEHILIESGDFAEVRQRYDAEGLPQLFQEIRVTCVFDFSHDMELFYRIHELLVYDDI